MQYLRIVLLFYGSIQVQTDIKMLISNELVKLKKNHCSNTLFLRFILPVLII